LDLLGGTGSAKHANKSGDFQIVGSPKVSAIAGRVRVPNGYSSCLTAILSGSIWRWHADPFLEPRFEFMKSEGMVQSSGIEKHDAAHSLRR
jgi:hypothetical protein